MVEIRRILFCHDFSDTADFALSYAVLMAEKFSASLYLIHVIEENTSQQAFTESLISEGQLRRIHEDVEKNAEQRLDDIRESHVSTLKECHPVISKGMPFLEIINVAKEKEIDLIIMGTHGRTGLSHLFFGSVAERVLRESSCPVMTVRMPSK